MDSHTRDDVDDYDARMESHLAALDRNAALMRNLLGWLVFLAIVGLGVLFAVYGAVADMRSVWVG